jgi:hypothetical protein
MLESINPGVTVLPAASMTRAPSGAFITPTAAIRPPRITIVPRSIAGPDTGRIRALVIATTSPVADGARAGRRRGRRPRDAIAPRLPAAAMRAGGGGRMPS